MRVLLISATGLSTSDAPFFIAEALSRAGHEVTVLPVDDGLPPLPAAGWTVGGAGDPVYRAWFQGRARHVGDAFRPDAVLVYGSNWALEPDTLHYLRWRVGAQVVLWEVNQRFFGQAQARCLPLFDHVFCLDSYFIPVMKAGGLACVEHLMAAADPAEHRPLPLTEREEERYGADVTFVGTHHPGRAELLAGLGDLGLRVALYGRRWERAAPPVSGWVRGEPVYGRKKTVVYCASSLSFHDRGPHMVHGENFRVFEVAACGGVSLTRPSVDLGRCFAPGEGVLTFEDAAGLRKQVRAAIGDPGRLAEVAEAGRQRVLKEHTYDHRCAVLTDHLIGGPHPH